MCGNEEGLAYVCIQRTEITGTCVEGWERIVHVLKTGK